MDPAQCCVACSVRIYRSMLAVYPAAFRWKYGSEMAQVFQDACRDALWQRGLPGLLAVWSDTLPDLIVSVYREWSFFVREERILMANNDNAFGERLAQVLGEDPTYYSLLVSSEPSRRMWELVESLALEGDPDQPETALALFEELSEGVPEEQRERWLAGLKDAAKRMARSLPVEGDETLANRIMRMVYADPEIYELFAAVEPGNGLLELIENLALEGNAEDIETMLHLMRLCALESQQNQIESV